MNYPEVGRVYFRKRGGKAEVVRVVAVDAEWVTFSCLHGPDRALRIGTAQCKTKNFSKAGWSETAERGDYSDLDGAERFATFEVRDTQGQPILRCSAKRAAFYLRKGYARQLGDGVLQFTDSQTEERLRVLYLGEFSEFFQAVKNDRCVCCGTTSNLTRHHVVPKRHKKLVPQPWRSCLSNVLFLCGSCHTRYEETPEPDSTLGDDWRTYVCAWRDHFLSVLEPKFVQPGWDIISVKNFAALDSEIRESDCDGSPHDVQ